MVPFSGDLVPDIDVPDGLACCLGSYSMRHVAKKKRWVPGVFDLEPFDFRIQSAIWGIDMLNADSWIGPFKNAVLTEASFCRPIHDSKYFAGRVFEPEEFHEWQHKVAVLKEDYGNSLTGETLIQVCKPKEIYQEVRYWIVDGKIITKSIYKVGDRVQYSSEVDMRYDWFVSYLLQRWNPHVAFVLDVCDTPNGMKVVEINTLNAAGFYAGDIPAVVMAIEDLYRR